MHKFKNAIIQKVEMNIKKAQERDKFYYDTKHCNLKVCAAHYTVTYLLYNAIPPIYVGIWSRGSSTFLETAIETLRSEISCSKDGWGLIQCVKY